MKDGHYWAIHRADDTFFIVKAEEGLFFVCGIEHPIDFVKERADDQARAG